MLTVLVLYEIYSAIRNLSEGSKAQAFRHAREVMHWQHMIGLNFEATLQSWALHFTPLIVFLNYFYGSLHFIVTAGAVIWLYSRHPGDYPRWRNTLVLTTALALIGFAFFPLMPPRLLPAHYGFVDTLQKFGGLWSFDSGPSTTSRTSTPPCPASTSAGRCSAPRRWRRGSATGWPGRPPPSIRC